MGQLASRVGVERAQDGLLGSGKAEAAGRIEHLQQLLLAQFFIRGIRAFDDTIRIEEQAVPRRNSISSWS